MNYKKFGYLCLDYFTRTWTAFWGTLAFCAVYILIQHWHKFDGFPWLGLCTVVTLLSYFQNIIIMTIQREDHEVQMRLEKLEQARDQKVYEMVEDIFEEVVEDGHTTEGLVNDESERRPSDATPQDPTPEIGGCPPETVE